MAQGRLKVHSCPLARDAQGHPDPTARKYLSRNGPRTHTCWNSVFSSTQHPSCRLALLPSPFSCRCIGSSKSPLFSSFQCPWGGLGVGSLLVCLSCWVKAPEPGAQCPSCGLILVSLLYKPWLCDMHFLEFPGHIRHYRYWPQSQAPTSSCYCSTRVKAVQEGSAGVPKRERDSWALCSLWTWWSPGPWQTE